MRNIMVWATVATLVLGAVVTTAQDDEKDYFTGLVVGDAYVICGAGEETPAGDVSVDFEEEFGFCLGGNTFVDLEEGDYSITLTDELALSGPSGALRVEDPEGGVLVDNVDTCFDEPLSTEVPEGASIIVWVDGVLFWSTGQPCGVGQSSQGTYGTITIRLN